MPAHLQPHGLRSIAEGEVLTNLYRSIRPNASHPVHSEAACARERAHSLHSAMAALRTQCIWLVTGLVSSDVWKNA